MRDRWTARCRTETAALQLRAFLLATRREGLAAVEFALVLPIMLLMYLGLTELTFAVNQDMKLTNLARTVGDLTGRSQTMNTNDMNAIFGAAKAVVSPFDAEAAEITVSSVVVKTTTNGQGQQTVSGEVCWSRGNKTGLALAKGTKVDVPEGFKSSASFIQTKVRMAYKPLLGTAVLEQVTGQPTLDLGVTTPWPVRNVPQVIWEGTPAC
jgi:Flp pilus assembly protein TadG